MTTDRAATEAADCYDFPEDYERAFDFRDLPAEVAVIERLRLAHAPGLGKSLLQLACGPAQHLPALVAAGYRYSGLDLSAAMLDRARAAAVAIGTDATFHRASMIDFRLDEPVDLIFVALGDLYARDAGEFAAFLDSCAAALNPGGLILLDWCIQFQPEKTFKAEGDSWTMESDGVRIDAKVTMVPVSAVEQSFDEVLELAVDDHDTHRHLKSVARKYAVYPQQFLSTIAAHPALEFRGWWNNWNPDEPLEPGTSDIFRPIALLSRSATF